MVRASTVLALLIRLHWKATLHHDPMGTNAFDFALRAVRSPGGGGGTVQVDVVPTGTKGVALLLSLLCASTSRVIPNGMKTGALAFRSGVKGTALILSSGDF